jgi:hypothetical protein
MVLFGCETWSLTLREESRLMVFENRVLRRVFGSKRDEVTGEWRMVKITDKKFHGNTFSGSRGIICERKNISHSIT